MENSKINFGKVVIKVLEVLVAKVFVLPFKIYKNTLINLSDNKKTGGDNSLSDDFPVYLWFINIFEASIALIYPLGALAALGILIVGESYNPAGEAVGVLVAAYFAPLYFQLIKELFSLTLKMLQYLKDISKN
jgi:hypothetical protein